MPDDRLEPEVAKSLAMRLKAIPGFPWDEDNIVATAEDLMCWCTGSIQGRVLTKAEEQAQWLVNELRLRWTEKWLGPGMMLKVFRSKFEVDKLAPERQTFDTKQWEKEYGPPDRGWSKRLPKAITSDKNDVANEIAEMRHQAIREAIYYTEGPGQSEIAGQGDEKRKSQGFWQDAMAHHVRTHPEEVAGIRAQIQSAQIAAVPPDPRLPSEERRKLRELISRDREAQKQPKREVVSARAPAPCPACNGTGRLAFDEYCGCKLGRDLQKIEREGA